MQLQADAVDRDAAMFEVFEHFVDRVGLVIEEFAFGFVVEKERVRVSFAGPAEDLLQIGRPLAGKTDAGLVVPG